MRHNTDTEFVPGRHGYTRHAVGVLVIALLVVKPALGNSPTDVPHSGDRHVVRIAYEHLEGAPHRHIDPCSFDPAGAVLYLTEAEIQELRVPFERLGSLEDHLRRHRPAKTLASVGAPSIARVLGEPVIKTAAGGLAPGTIHLEYDRYHTPTEGIDFFSNLAGAFSDIAVLQSIGKSVEDRDLWALRITDNPQVVEADEAQIFFCALHHAREWATHELILNLAEYLLTRYESDLRVQHIVDNSVVWILLAANPDGFEYTWTVDRMWRKNRQPNGGGSYGVDLNRNYEYNWEYDSVGSSGNPWSETYRGPSPASEPETQAIQAFLEAEKPAIAVTYHTYSQLVLYPWGYTGTVNMEAYTSLRAIADRYASIAQSVHGMTYTPGTINYGLYPVNGDLTDYAYGAHGILAYTPELRPASYGLGGFSLPEEQIKPNNEENLLVALWLMDNVASVRFVDGPPAGFFAAGDNPFSLPLTPINQKPQLALGMDPLTTDYLTAWLDDLEHLPPGYGAYAADFEGIGSGSGYRFEYTPESAAWADGYSGYKALPYVFEDGAVVMIENLRQGPNHIGIPSEAPVRMRDIRIYQRRIEPVGTTFGRREQILEMRTALQDLHHDFPWILWEWTHTAADGTVFTSHPEGLNGADEFVHPHRSYAFTSLQPSYTFGSMDTPVQLLLFPPPVRGDVDLDSDFDLTDHAQFAGCMTGPVQEQLEGACRLFDIDHDFDIDANDLARLQQEFAPAE